MSFRLMKPLSIGTGDKDVVLEAVQLPVLASPKLDGIRACWQNGLLLSNSGMPIASRDLTKKFTEAYPTLQIDGEFIYGDPTDEHCYNLTQSAVNSINFPADMDINKMHFYVFDFKSHLPVKAAARYELLKEYFLLDKVPPFFELLPQTLLTEASQIDAFYQECLEKGYEGAIFKHVDRPYKEGRSGKTQQVMLRLKPFGKEFFEAQIIGYECAYHNSNEAETSALGYAKRSSAADGKIPLDMLGVFVVKDCKSGVEFRLPVSSMTHQQRIDIWKDIDSYVGKYVRYTCMTYGGKTAPRMPSYRGFRDISDFSPKGKF